MTRLRLRCSRIIAPVGAACLLVFTGCSTVIAPVTSRVTEGLTTAVLDHNDPETVRQGAPAYLLMVDAMIAGDPDNTGLLIAGAQLYSSYTSAFVEDTERASRLAERGRSYGWRGLCEAEPITCESWTLPFDEFAIGGLLVMGDDGERGFSLVKTGFEGCLLVESVGITAAAVAP